MRLSWQHVVGSVLMLAPMAGNAAPEAGAGVQVGGQVQAGGQASGQTAQTGTSAEGGVEFRKGASLSPQEQATQAQEYRTKMDEILRRMEKLAEMSRREKDIIKLNCVNDKLIPAKGLMNVGDQANLALEQATANKDDAARGHEFSRLTIAYQKVLVLGQEAEACVGEELAYIEKTQVEMTLDPNLTDQDPTEVRIQEPIIERPPTASPYN